LIFLVITTLSADLSNSSMLSLVIIGGVLTKSNGYGHFINH